MVALPYLSIRSCGNNCHLKDRKKAKTLNHRPITRITITITIIHCRRFSRSNRMKYSHYYRYITTYLLTVWFTDVARASLHSLSDKGKLRDTLHRIFPSRWRPDISNIPELTVDRWEIAQEQR